MPVGRPDWTGKVNVFIVKQEVPLYAPRDWGAKEAEDKDFCAGTIVSPGTEESVTLYTTPAGKLFLLCDAIFDSEVKGITYVRRAGIAIMRLRNPAYDTRFVLTSKPKPFAEGELFSVGFYNDDTVTGRMGISAGGIEISVASSSSSSSSNPQARRVTEAWRKGEFNLLNLEIDSVRRAVLILMKRGWGRSYKAKLKFKQDGTFEVLEDEEIGGG